MDVYNDSAKWKEAFWLSICMEMKWGTKTVQCQIMWAWTFLGGGVRGVQVDDILSMHLESHIGLFSAPLYDFNGKALWEHAPQEISKMKCVGWWLEVNGCFLFFFFFFFSLLAFSLVYFVGLVSQSSDIPLSSKSHINNKGFPQLTTRGHSERRKKNIPVQAKCKLMGRVWMNRKRQYELKKKNKKKNAYTQSSLIHGFCLIFFYIVKKWIFFVFTWIFFHIYLHHSHR